jgi:hypothetical protein
MLPFARFLLAGFLLAAPPLLSAAGEPAPTITAEKGKPYLLTTADGREATLRITHADSSPQRIPFQISDNNCSNHQNMSCFYRFTLRKIQAALYWSKNPDPSRINQKVKRHYNERDTSGETLEASAVSAGANPSPSSPFTAGLPGQEIECTDFSWLPESPAEAPASLYISRWEDEQNSTNPETGLNENRVSGGRINIELERLSATRMKVVKAESSTYQYSILELFLQSPISSITLVKSDGSICQVGISGALDFIKIYEKIKATPENAGAMPPYITGSDETLDHPILAREIKQWISSNTTERIYK